jgi:transcriptional regulator with XRE-family HTH domain
MANDKFSRELGRWLADKRNVAGLTQQEAADRMECTNTRISNWECGVRDMSAKELVRYCEIIGADLDELADFFRRSTHAGV